MELFNETLVPLVVSLIVPLGAVLLVVWLVLKLIDRFMTESENLKGIIRVLSKSLVYLLIFLGIMILIWILGILVL